MLEFMAWIVAAGMICTGIQRVSDSVNSDSIGGALLCLGGVALAWTLNQEMWTL